MLCKWLDQGQYILTASSVTNFYESSDQRWSASFDCTASWKGHDGIVLSSVITYRNGTEENVLRLISGGNDDYIKVCATSKF